MAKYPGLEQYQGIGGQYRVVYMDEDPVIEVYLRSVPAFERSRTGRLFLPSPAERSYPDICFIIDGHAQYWSIISMEVPSFGLNGVNEFVFAMLQEEGDMTQVDVLLPHLQTLLDRPYALWGELPGRLEDEQESEDARNTIGMEYHPGL